MNVDNSSRKRSEHSAMQCASFDGACVDSLGVTA